MNSYVQVMGLSSYTLGQDNEFDLLSIAATRHPGNKEDCRALLSDQSRHTRQIETEQCYVTCLLLLQCYPLYILSRSDIVSESG